MTRLVIVTDRRQVRDEVELVARLAAAVRAAPAGTVAIQIREKDLDGGPLARLARAVVALGAPVWLNDRIDVALAVGAHGVHLPEAGFTVADARRLAPGLRIGVSRHTAADARAAGADLVQLGPIWPTPGKDGALGPEVLGAARTGHATLVAVGGIDGPARAREAAAAGADAVAVIRAFWTAPDPAEAAREIVAAVFAGRPKAL